MDHVKVVEELERFSGRARSEFRHMEYFYFHNCLYEGVWREQPPTPAGIAARRSMSAHPYGSDYRVIFVGDAAMSPYEIVAPRRSVEHWNEEPDRSGSGGA